MPEPKWWLISPLPMPPATTWFGWPSSAFTRLWVLPGLPVRISSGSDFAFTSADRACVVVPNFAIGAVLMMRFAELAAPYFDTAEVIELHHNAKIDAPSGTARLTVERMAAASSTWAPDPTEHEMLTGVRGAEGPAGIRVHSVRMGGMVAHHEVILGTEGQTLTIRHDSTDRASFMPGVLAAVKAVPGHSGLIVGLDTLLAI